MGSGADTCNDNSECAKKDGFGVVDKVFCDYIDSSRQRMCKVRIATTREPFLVINSQVDTVKKVLLEWY